MSNACSIDRVPRYRLHNTSGQAVVTLGGRDTYLGTYRSAASREAYQRAVAEWLQCGGQPPAGKDTVTVVEVIAAYDKYARGYYRKDGKPTNEVRMIKTALKIVRRLYGRTIAVDFGPLALKACRAEMICQDWCRSHINRQTDRIKRMFKWATSEELIPGNVYESLRCVAGLMRGRTEAREGGKVKPICEPCRCSSEPMRPSAVTELVCAK
jgi:hypothetical protein